MMKKITLQSIAGSSVKIKFTNTVDAKQFAEYVNNMKDDEEFLIIDKDVKNSIYNKNEEVIKNLIELFRITYCRNIKDDLNMFNIINDTIKHINRLEMFFYDVVRLDNEDKN